MDLLSKKDRDSSEGWVLLTTAENEFEFNLIKGRLAESDIICVGKGRDYDLLDSGFLNVVLGPCIPVDIMVLAEKYQEAREIIDSKISDEELEALAVQPEQEEEEQ